MQTLKKMLALEWIFIKLSAICDLQMRMNVFIQFFNDILWYLVQIILFEALYLHVDSLSGWTIADMRVFLGLAFFVDALQMVFFAHNFDMLPEKISHGDVELMLVKPGNTLGILTMQRLQCAFFLNLAFAGIWLGWSLAQLPGGFSWSTLILLLLVIPPALSIFYSVRLLFATSALITVRAENILEIFFSFLRLGLRPDRLYSPGLRYLILMVIPVGMIASVPARLLVEPFDIGLLALLFGVAGLFLFAAIRFWHFALKRYCST